MTDIEKYLQVENKVNFYFKIMLNRVERNTKIILALLVVLIIILLFGRCTGVKVQNPVDSIARVDANTIDKDSCYAQVFAVKKELAVAIDSLHIAKDSLQIVMQDYTRYKDSILIVNKGLNEDLFVAKFKLTRIREYNRIAGQRNNIKYLRGWINRVLAD